MSPRTRLVLIALGYLAACAGAFLFAAFNPDLGWPIFAAVLIGGVYAVSHRARSWRRRAFYPLSDDDEAAALDRQILQTRIAVGIFIGLGALVVLATIWVGVR